MKITITHDTRPEKGPDAASIVGKISDTLIWHKEKTYISEDMDQDMVDSPSGCKVVHVTMNNIHITSKSQIADLRRFLANLQEALPEKK